MKICYCIILLFTIIFSSYNAYISENDILKSESLSTIDASNLVIDNKRSITTKFRTPEGFTRIKPSSPFAVYLNLLPLKGENGVVKLFDGNEKLNRSSYAAVIDLQPFNNNIQFHNNAIFRLRAEYLYHNKMYDKINFKINNKLTYVPYTKFAQGDYSYKKFMAYVELFLNATTPISLAQNSTPINLQQIKIGDIFMQKSSSKSHAVIVMDIAKNQKGNKIMLLAQSYYPGQDIQIITNPLNDNLSPWFEVKEGILLTPEWRFMSSDLIRFD